MGDDLSLEWNLERIGRAGCIGILRGDDPDALIVDLITVDQGPTQKRFRPRARGRTGKILKRTCHVQVVLGEPK